MLHAVENDPMCWGAVAVRHDGNDELAGCYPDMGTAEAAIVAARAFVVAPYPDPLSPEEVEERLAEMRANPPTRRPLPGWPR